MSEAVRLSVSNFLLLEAKLVDSRKWDDWLELFAEDAEYWIPAWKSELEPTVDPNTELSLIYYNSRLGLEDRVFRLRTEASSASIPLPRTCHLVTNIEVEEQDINLCLARANFHALSYRFGETQSFFGTYDYHLAMVEKNWRIKRKRITVLNDVIDTVLDFFNV